MRRPSLPPLLAAFFLLALVAAPPAGAARLDDSFGGNGAVRTEGPGTLSPATAIAQDRAGRIVAVTSDRYRNQFVVARYLENGDLDPSLGSGGIVRYRGRGGAVDVAIQNDGKIVVVGGETCVMVMRLLPSGALDPTFSPRGRPGKTLACALEDRHSTASLDATSVAVKNSGTILVGGVIHPSRYRSGGFLIRVTPEGRFDKTFRGDRRTASRYPGIVQLLPPVGSYSGIGQIRLGARGRILAAGFHRGRFLIARFNANGTLDSRFARKGLATLDVAGSFECGCEIAVGLARDKRGRFLLASSAGSGPGDPDEGILVRLSRKGRHDRSFGHAGVARIRGEEFALIRDVAVQPDGKIVVAGARDFRLMVARFNSRGRPDAGFFSGGIYEGEVDSFSGDANDLLIDRENRLVAAGGDWQERDAIALVRILPN